LEANAPLRAPDGFQPVTVRLFRPAFDARGLFFRIADE